jgi:hypothetical protein
VLYSKHARLYAGLNLCRCRFQPELKLWRANHLHLPSVPFMAHPRKVNLSTQPCRRAADWLFLSWGVIDIAKLHVTDDRALA